MTEFDQIFTSKGYGATTSGPDYSNEEFLEKRLSTLDEDKNILEAERMLVLKKALQSESPRLLVKAQGYLDHLIEDQVRSKEGSAVIVDPDISHYSKGGYISKRFALSPDYLRKMAQTPVLRSIITTRQTQVSRFSRPQGNQYDYGFKIQKKPKHYSRSKDDITEADEKRIEELTNFILNCGDNKDSWGSDNFDQFLQKITEDSLVLDAAVFETVPRRNGQVYSFHAVDGGTIYKSDIQSNNNNYEARTGGEAPKEIRGYYPTHVQVVNDRIVADWYPWELCYGIRNARTELSQNGYGRSELEDLVTIITALLNTEKYNSNFFTQGSNPKGILKMPDGANRNRINEMRQQWMSMVSGVNNAWKIPILEGKGIEWIDLQKSNSDMEFSAWQEYLIKITCAIYKISPDEIGFTFQNAGSLGGSGKEAETRLEYSKDKGLNPLLKSIEFWINKWILSQVDEGFEFIFVGIDSDSEAEATKRDIELSQSIMGVKEIRTKRGLPAKLEEGDVILNQQWIQWETQKQMAEEQQESNDVVDEEAADEVTWDSLDLEGADEVVKGILTKHAGNPMMVDAINVLTKAITSGE